MLSQLAHRGPDGEGLVDFGRSMKGTRATLLARGSEMHPGRGAHCVLGHRRLSIIDLSDGGRQPMATPDGRLHITFNGEIYNYIELRAELADRYTFRSSSDTEVLLAAYARWGQGMLSRLDGMFAFVILDTASNELFAARDPIGIKPFYYTRGPASFAFASEPAPLLAAMGGSVRLDPAHTAEFLLFGVSDHDDGTIFAGVNQLPGGHTLHLHLGSRELAVRPYWQPTPIDAEMATALPDRYRSAASLAIARQLRSDVPVGSSLSGGIDSSTIVALAGQALGPRAHEYTTLTFSFPGFHNDESAYAQEVARSAGMRWLPVVPSMETLADDLDRMVGRMAEPFTSLSMFAQYKVMERAGELGLKVMLDGQGGDEVYMGYARVAEGVMTEHLARGRLRSFVREWIGMRDHHSVPLWRSLAGRIYFNSPTIMTRRAMHRLARYVQPDFLAQARPEVARDWFGAKPAAQKQLDELRRYCLPRLLRYADRNSMAFGVEQRVPHLSKPILDLALAVPVERRVVDGWTKHYVREAMRGTIPDAVLWSRVKRGFDIPQSEWVAHLAPRIEQWVGDLPPGSPFDPTAILNDLRDPARNGAHRYWGIISTIATMQQLGARA